MHRPVLVVIALPALCPRCPTSVRCVGLLLPFVSSLHLFHSILNLSVDDISDWNWVIRYGGDHFDASVVVTTVPFLSLINGSLLTVTVARLDGVSRVTETHGDTLTSHLGLPADFIEFPTPLTSQTYPAQHRMEIVWRTLMSDTERNLVEPQRKACFLLVDIARIFSGRGYADIWLIGFLLRSSTTAWQRMWYLALQRS